MGVLFFIFYGRHAKGHESHTFIEETIDKRSFPTHAADQIRIAIAISHGIRLNIGRIY